MLLGQIVAISFATNLFLLTLLLSPPPPPSSSSLRTLRSRWLGPWLLNLGAIFATAIPALLLADEHYWHHSSEFLPVLLAPHVALLVLPFARALVPARYFSSYETAFNDQMYPYMWFLTCGSAGFVLSWTTYKATSYGGIQGIWSALLEHPAVSSVGFDVIFCWITWICWFRTQDGGIVPVVKESIESVKEAYAHDGTGTAIENNGFDGSVRRR
jgi:hypothetical protein